MTSDISTGDKRDTTEVTTDSRESDSGPLGTVGRGDTQSRRPLEWISKTALLFYVIFRRDLTHKLRYPVNFLGSLVSTLLVFVVIVEGGRQLSGPAFTDRVGGIVVGYLVFVLAQASYRGLSTTVKREANWGTLERLYLSPLGFGRLMGITAVSNVLLGFLRMVIVFPIVLFVAGTSLSVDPVTVVPLTTLGLASIVGFGFLLGGASVVYKRVGSVFYLFQYGLLALIAVPVEQFPWARFLPLVQANDMLGRAMRDGTRLWEFSPSAFAVLIGVSVSYLVAGYLAFVYLVNRARRRGVLGDY